MPELSITAIPAFADNYIWMIRTGGTVCAVVDPGEAEPVIETLKSRGLDLRYILLTHHHPDHIGGMAALKQLTGATVFGPGDERIAGVDHTMTEGDDAGLADLGLSFRVIEVPGHTRTHIAFYGHGCLFSGDTLFSVGCGRLFEGSPEQMQVSLDKLAALDPQTRVYCGHEYTVANCQFALEVEPGNKALQARAAAAKAAREQGQITLPSVLREELAVNPFLRSRAADVVTAARKRQPHAAAGASTLAVIRQWKDAW